MLEGRTRAPGGPSSGETRERILDAADRLFGTRGYRGTSMRALTAEAGVNVAAVNYHFGTKEGLLRAAVSRHLSAINAERLARLDKLEAESPGRIVPLERILDAFCRPALEFRHTSEQNAVDIQRIVAMIHSEPAAVMRPLLQEVFRGITDRFTSALARALPHLDPLEVFTRFHLGVGCMIHLISHRSPLADRVTDAEAFEQMLAFLAAAFRAPSLRESATTDGGPA